MSDKVYISEISLNDKEHPGLSKDFQWKNIRLFQVVSGKNGSGKSKLLDFIKKNYDEYVIRYIDVKHQAPLYSSLPILGDAPNFYRTGEKYYERDKDGNEREFSYLGDRAAVQGIMTNLDNHVLRNIVKRRKVFMESNYDLYVKELQREQRYLEDRNKDKFLEDGFEPWDEIDRILNDAVPHLRLKRSTLSSDIKFLRRIDGEAKEKELLPEQLSSGELLVYSLALAKWGSDSGIKSQVLLIDEFDAHLNPCLMKSFIDVIKNSFVDQGVQVIMATHSPSTLIYAEEVGADLIWMENGKIIKGKDPAEIIQELSSGLITVHSITKDLKILLGRLECNILFTEGKTDESHLLNAIKALNMEKEFFGDAKKHNNIFIFGCSGVETMPIYVKSNSAPRANQTQVALFDNDEGGRTISKSLDEKVKKVFVSQEEGVVEKLLNLDDEFINKNFLQAKDKLKNCTSDLKNGTKKNLVEKISKLSQEKQKEIYKNFEPLLQNILKEFGKE